MRSLVWSATIAACLMGAACDGGGLPTQPSPQSQPTTHAPFVPAPGSNGIFTWVSIIATRPLCAEITNQVGATWSIWVAMDADGEAVTLTLSESPPSPFDDPPARFKGTRLGHAILASRTGPMGGMACPRDTRITPQTGGDLTATISGNQIAGEITEIFGTGLDQATFAFTFRATLPEH